jgi:TPR repeat protein
MLRNATLLIAALCLQGHALSARADKDPFDEAMHVYGCADYPKALKMFIPLAEKGDRMSQFQVGMMIEQGQGADPNLNQAFDWYMKAAQQGVADAYFALGQIYSRGEIVAKDPVKAFAWFDLAKKGGHSVAGDWLKMEATRLKPEDIPVAQNFVSDWLAKVGR